MCLRGIRTNNTSLGATGFIKSPCPNNPLVITDIYMQFTHGWGRDVWLRLGMHACFVLCCARAVCVRIWNNIDGNILSN